MRTLLRGLPVFAGELPEFDAEAVPADPATLFAQWLALAIEQQVPEPHAMTVSTADGAGQPSSRVLICKDVDQAGRWSFASGASSRKGRDLAVNPRAALLFYWPQQGRQVHVRGTVAPAEAAASAADFLARPPDSRAESLSGRQSDVLGDPADVGAALTQAKAELAARPDLVAPGWTLYVLTAQDVEFWQARRDRQHARLCYERAGSSWTRLRRWP
jgi:pyridoxamine 5'-phosphate oxidase